MADSNVISISEYCEEMNKKIDNSTNYRETEDLVGFIKNEDDKPTNCRQNFVLAIAAIVGEKLATNEMDGRMYIKDGAVSWDKEGRTRAWTDTDDCQLRLEIEMRFGLSNLRNYSDAVASTAYNNRFNPFLDMLESAQETYALIGGSYIRNLLPDYLGVKDDNYQHEVMRLVMLAVIHRAYSPGAKFDYVPVLYGSQGIGKSSFFRLLCIREEWYLENLSDIGNAKAAAELIRGKIMAEFNEMLALKGKASVEKLKSFVTQTADDYREAYGRHSVRFPRRCVFIGTTNEEQFLTDPTGNRRFLPIITDRGRVTRDLFSDDTLWRFKLAWGEAATYYHANGVRLLLSKESEKTADKLRRRCQEEDARIGVIQEYLDNLKDDKVCCAMIFYEGLHNPIYSGTKDMTKRDSNEITRIMDNEIEGWVRTKRTRFDNYGSQQAWVRV